MHGYTASGLLSVTYNAGTGYDLILIAAAAAVPVYVDRIQLTAVVTGNPQLEVQFRRRSTASTGGSSVVSAPDSPSSPAASTVITTINTSTTGTAVVESSLDENYWQQFGPYIYDARPRDKCITPGKWAGLYMPTPVNATVLMKFRLEYREAK